METFNVAVGHRPSDLLSKSVALSLKCLMMYIISMNTYRVLLWCSNVK